MNFFIKNKLTNSSFVVIKLFQINYYFLKILHICNWKLFNIYVLKFNLWFFISSLYLKKISLNLVFDIIFHMYYEQLI